MALIQCGECRRSISSLAPACVHCGAATPGYEDVSSRPGDSFSTQSQTSSPRAEAPSDAFDAAFASAFKGSDRPSGTPGITTTITHTYGPGDEIPASVQALIKAGFDSATSSNGATTTTTRTYGPGDEMPAAMQDLMKAAFDSASLATGKPEAATSAPAQARAAPASAPAAVFPVPGVSDTDEPEASAPKRSFSILLWLGVLVVPPVFVWFLLRKGHSIPGRILGFSWLVFNVFAWELGRTAVI